MTPMPSKARAQLDKKIRAYVKTVGADHPAARYAAMTYSDFLSNKMLVVRVIRKGLPYAIFHLIQGLSPFSPKEWAELLNVSGKSLQRYRESDKNFKPIHTEKIIELSEVTELGMKVFGDEAKFKLWLETPVFALGNNTPVSLLKDSYGKEMVAGELLRISHGILV